MPYTASGQDSGVVAVCPGIAPRRFTHVSRAAIPASSRFTHVSRAAIPASAFHAVVRLERARTVWREGGVPNSARQSRNCRGDGR